MATKPDIYNGIPRNGGGKPPASTALTNTPAQKQKLGGGMLPPSQPKTQAAGPAGSGRALTSNMNGKGVFASSKLAPAQGNANSTRMLAPSQPAKTLPMKHVTQGAGVGVGKAVGIAMTKGMKSAKGAFNKMKGRGKKVPI
jgi:hypothetical protein